jgi:hypothetical protein
MNMNIRSTLAALAAISTLCPTPAFADEGKMGKRYWVKASSMEDAIKKITNTVIRGDEACFGSARNHTCYGFNPLTREVRLQEVNRPIGSNKNHAISTIVNTTINIDTGLQVERNEAGLVLSRFQVGSEQQNGTAMLIQGLTGMLPAFANGMGSTVVCTIAGCGNNGGGGATAISISDAAANQLFEGVFGTGGGCTTGSCAYRPKE